MGLGWLGRLAERYLEWRGYKVVPRHTYAELQRAWARSLRMGVGLKPEPAVEE